MLGICVRPTNQREIFELTVNLIRSHGEHVPELFLVHAFEEPPQFVVSSYRDERLKLTPGQFGRSLGQPHAEHPGANNDTRGTGVECLRIVRRATKRPKMNGAIEAATG